MDDHRFDAISRENRPAEAPSDSWWAAPLVVC
jgi:hypothetical protein